jgi:phosphate transport system substrate-binding protein
MKSYCQRLVLSVLVLLPAGGSAMAQVKVDPNLPEYRAVQGVSGTIKSVGSDTMNNLMTLWAEGFREFYPNVLVEVEGKGSGTAPPALIGGTATFGPMSRDWKDEEVSRFESKFGYKPTVIPSCIDMLAVLVHKDNPIKGLTLPQVDAIFSQTRKLGFNGTLRTWGDAGLAAAWEKQPISLYGRNEASGTYVYFKEHALGGGDFKSTVKSQPGSSNVIQSVAKDRYGIGYAGVGYLTADVRGVPLATDTSSEFVPVEPESAYSGEYPLVRPLYLSVNFKPNSDLDPLRREFLRFVLSKQGQEIVIKDGYLPIPAEAVEEARSAVGIED